MLNERTDRSPVGRLSGWLAVLGLVALTVPIAGLSLSTVRDDVPPAGVSPRLADVVLPAAPAAMSAPKAPAAAVPRAAGLRHPSETNPQAAAPATFMLAVVLSNALTGEAKEGATDQSGEFRAANLAPGDYRLSASRPGFKTLTLGLELLQGQLTTSRVTLRLGMLAEVVVVSAQTGAAPAAVGAAQPGVAVPTGSIAPQPRRVGSAPKDDLCSQSTEGGCVTPPRKLVDARPVYPAWAIDAGTSGTIVLKGKVGTDGQVGSLQPATESNGDLAKAAMDAVSLWGFSPTRLNGVPVEVDIEVTVQFVVYKK